MPHVEIVPMKPTSLLLPIGTEVYHATRGEKPHANVDDWKGLVCTTLPLFMGVSELSGGKILPLTTRKYTHHLRLDTIPNKDEIEAIRDSYFDVTGGQLSQDDLKNKVGSKVAETVADYGQAYFKVGGFLERRARAIKTILAVSGYQGTAEPLSPDLEPSSMRLSFFHPGISLRQSEADPEKATSIARENNKKFLKLSGPMFRS